MLFLITRPNDFIRKMGLRCLEVMKLYRIMIVFELYMYMKWFDCIRTIFNTKNAMLNLAEFNSVIYKLKRSHKDSIFHENTENQLISVQQSSPLITLKQ